MKSLASPLPVMAGIFAIAVLSGMDALVKGASADYQTGQIVFLRYLFGAAGLLMLVPFLKNARPTVGTIRRAGIRALFIVATAYFFFRTLTYLPLAEAVAVSFTAPFFMVILARVLLGEPIAPDAVLAIAIGFCGVLVMASGRLGGGDGDPMGYVTGLTCSVTYALAMIMTRKDSGHDGVVPLVLAQNVAATLYAAPLAVSAWATPSPAALALFAGIGSLGLAGHLAFAYAYSNAPASRLAPLEFTGLVWAAIFGLAFFGEVPTPWTLGGAALIVGACLVVFRRT